MDNKHYLDAAQLTLVQASFAQLSEHTDTLPDLFYARLFALNPSLRAMFSSDLAALKLKLMALLKLVVSELDRPDEWLPIVHALGRGHQRYGVTPQHYEQVQVALLWALDVLLEKAFTPAVNDAWSGAYRLLAEAMQEATLEIPPCPNITGEGL